METKNTVTLGFDAYPSLSGGHYGNISDMNANIIPFLLLKYNILGRILIALKEYLQFTNKFQRIDIFMNYKEEFLFRNGTLNGLLKNVNHSEVDIGVALSGMNELVKIVVDFSYPMTINDMTFVTRKLKNKPNIFGIFQTFSISVWITIASVLFAMMVVKYVILNRKWPFDTISLNVFAILMKQNALITPSSFAHKLLIYSWVVGAMILCLSYDSVFLSFLSFPPVVKIRTLSDLASAVKKGDIHCLSFDVGGFEWIAKNDDREYLRIIGRDIIENTLSYSDVMVNFVRESKNQNLAYFGVTQTLDYYTSSPNFFVSEDRFYNALCAMMVRRGFCCKDLIDAFVHRMVASGIYSKIYNDGVFIYSMQFSLLLSEIDEDTLRKWTLTDVAPAFIFLLCGYFISFLVLIAEILINRKNVKHFKKSREIKRRRVNCEVQMLSISKPIG